VELKRGWIRASVAHGGQTWNLVTTHFEIQALAPVQAGQLAELTGSVMAGLEGPTILMGDLNSDAEAGPGQPSWTPSYETLLAQGFADTWTRGGLRSGPGGYTCCNDPDLMNGPGALDRRIDFVLVRSENPDLARHSETRVVGDRPSDRTPSGLWPSDHAGVVTHFRTPPGLEEE
jgi:endonuclease/exonuclease/phosphatase family metal-dependent hydrolase